MAVRAQVEMRLLDAPQVKAFVTATGHLIVALADMPDLPPAVLDALDEVCAATAGLGGPDIGPIPR